MMLRALIVLFCSVVTINVDALRCYTCSTSPEFLDQRCVTDPASVQGAAITDCNKNYCTSTRVEYLDPKDKVQSMVRGCIDYPPVMNQIVEDGTFRVYYKACQRDLCNGGSGKDISSESSLIGDEGDEVVLLVPGIGRSSSSILHQTVALITAMLIILRTQT